MNGGVNQRSKFIGLMPLFFRALTHLMSSRTMGSVDLVTRPTAVEELARKIIAHGLNLDNFVEPLRAGHIVGSAFRAI